MSIETKLKSSSCVMAHYHIKYTKDWLPDTRMHANIKTVFLHIHPDNAISYYHEVHQNNKTKQKTEYHISSKLIGNSQK